MSEKINDNDVLEQEMDVEMYRRDPMNFIYWCIADIQKLMSDPNVQNLVDRYRILVERLEILADANNVLPENYYTLIEEYKAKDEEYLKEIDTTRKKYLLWKKKEQLIITVVMGNKHVYAPLRV